jgi:hypothetical protein
MSAMCPSLSGRYVPWSFGEGFECLSCGQWVRQSHLVQPKRNPNGAIDYASVYPIPQHERKSSA